MSNNAQSTQPDSSNKLLTRQEGQLTAANVAAVASVLAELTEQPLTALEVADKLGMQPRDVFNLYNDSAFLQHFSTIQRNKAKVNFEMKGHARMERIIDYGTDKDAIAAYGKVSEVLGVAEAKRIKHDHQHTHKLDTIIRSLAAQGTVIDVDAEDVE